MHSVGSSVHECKLTLMCPLSRMNGIGLRTDTRLQEGRTARIATKQGTQISPKRAQLLPYQV